MKILKNKIVISCLTLLTLFSLSCDDNESGVTIIGLDAKFVDTIVLNIVSFDNVSQNATSYSWDFGDGTTSTLANPPAKEYCNNGEYLVTLTVSDDNGNSDTFQDTIVIDPGCDVTCEENIDPAQGNLNWTFYTTSDDTTFDAFGNTAGFIVDNPVNDAVNSSCRVQRFEKTTGCFTFAGLGVALDSPIDFSLPETGKTFTMKVLAETQVTEVTLRLEFMPFPNTEPSQDRVATITQVGEWQELTFDFTDVPSGTFQSMIVYFERNAPCDGDIYYFDDIIQQ